MKNKKFIELLSHGEFLPLSIHLLKVTGQQIDKNTPVKFGVFSKINTSGYSVYNFYKPISKF